MVADEWFSLLELTGYLHPTGCQLGCHQLGNWRGWMGIEPTQDASQRPANGFEDRGSSVRQCPAMSAQDEESRLGIRGRSRAFANVQQNGCQLGCQNLCWLGTHGPEPAQRCVLPYPGGSFRVLLYSIAELVVSSRVRPCPPGSGIA